MRHSAGIKHSVPLNHKKMIDTYIYYLEYYVLD
jgi:hypothetical protein